MNSQVKREDIKGEPVSSQSLQFRKIGNSVGLIFPKEMLTQLGMEEGDVVHVIRQPDHSVKLAKTDPDFNRVMTLAREIMKEYHNALAELAK